MHRDIKPGNLMLDGNGQVQILDFGLAKAMLEHEPAADLTLPAQTLGTPQFMAPEQNRDVRKADIRADVYSLGCTLYYLLSGAPPFTGTEIGDRGGAPIARGATAGPGAGGPPRRTGEDRGEDDGQGPR